MGSLSSELTEHLNNNRRANTEFLVWWDRVNDRLHDVGEAEVGFAIAREIYDSGVTANYAAAEIIQHRRNGGELA